MGLPGIVLTSFVTGISGAIMPGSLFVVVVSNAVHGVSHGMLPVAGHALAELAIVFALAYGLGDILSRPSVAASVAGAGACMLAWMAWDLFRSSLRSTTTIKNAPPASPGESLRLALTGIVATVSNPYWLLWWGTVGAGSVVLWKEYGKAGIGAVFAGHIMADLAWYLVVCLAISKGRNLITGKTYRALLSACGVLLLGLAVFFAANALRMVAQ
ncbi:MAG: LysE family transporter [Bacillota bacterium]